MAGLTEGGNRLSSLDLQAIPLQLAMNQLPLAHCTRNVFPTIGFFPQLTFKKIIARNCKATLYNLSTQGLVRNALSQGVCLGFIFFHAFLESSLEPGYNILEQRETLTITAPSLSSTLV